MRGVLLIGMLALAGCDQAPASMPITAASMSELAVVNNKVNDLTAKVEELEKNMPSLEDRVHVLKLGATGYSQIDAGIGVLTFQFTEIAAKGSGSNVSLLIGNPTNAAITDMTIWASWGPLNADGNPDYSKAASGELKIKGEIPGGRWSSHKVMIDGTKPDSLGFIAITGVLVGQIELFNAPA